MKDFLFIVFITFFMIAAYVSLSQSSNKGYESEDKACKAFYGASYTYLAVPYNEKKCVTQQGDVRYYDLIPRKGE